MKRLALDIDDGHVNHHDVEGDTDCTIPVPEMSDEAKERFKNLMQLYFSNEDAKLRTGIAINKTESKVSTLTRMKQRHKPAIFQRVNFTTEPVIDMKWQQN